MRCLLRFVIVLQVILASLDGVVILSAVNTLPEAPHGSHLKSVVFSPSGSISPEEPDSTSLHAEDKESPTHADSTKQTENTLEASAQIAVASLIRREAAESRVSSESTSSAAQGLHAQPPSVEKPTTALQKSEAASLARQAPQSGYGPQPGYAPPSGYGPQPGYAPQSGYPQTVPGTYPQTYGSPQGPMQGYVPQPYPAPLPSHGSGPASGHPQQQGGYAPMPYGLPPYGPPPIGAHPMAPPPPGMAPYPPMGADPNFVCDCKAYLKNADAYGSMDTAGGFKNAKNWEMEAGIQVEMPPQCVDECNGKFKKVGWIVFMSIGIVVVLALSYVIFIKFIRKPAQGGAEGGNARARDGASDVASDAGSQH